MLTTNFQTEHMELQSDIQLNILIMSLYQTFKRPLFPEKKIPPMHSHTLHIITFWQYVHLWATLFKDEAEEELKFHQKTLANTLRAH